MLRWAKYLFVKILTYLSLLLVISSIKLPFSFTRKHIIDLRSDTVTKPTPEMRAAMFDAEVGDDVFGEDPTIIALEEKISKLFQKESSLFFPTGTMSNLAATMSWCSSRGAEIILGDNSHMFLFEQGGAAQIAGVSPQPLPNMIDGTIDIDTIEHSIRGDNVHFPITELVAIENTHNACGGRVLPLEYIHNLKNMLSERYGKIPIHLDGARIWNAATALNIPLSDLVKDVDSVSVCLSKGLGAPAGSILTGPKSFLSKAKRIRKVLGGGMRQAGVLAAAGLKAIDDFNMGILSHDHRKAKVLANAIESMDAFSVEVDNVETNIVMITIAYHNHNKWRDNLATSITSINSAAMEVCNMLKERGILALPFGSNIIRLVTHRDITDEDIGRAITVFQEVSDYLSEISTLPLTLMSTNTLAYPTVATTAITAIVDTKESVNDGNQSAVIVFMDNISPLSSINNCSNSNSKSIQSQNQSSTHSYNTNTTIDAEFISISSSPLPLSSLSSSPPPPLPSSSKSSSLGSPIASMISNETFYEEVLVHGMSVSDNGFVVLLRGLICDRILSVYVTPSDPMSDGLDRDIPETAEAVTLLQLLQGIDVESHLPRDTLLNKFFNGDSSGGIKQQMYLKRVMIDNVTKSKVFQARFCGVSRDSTIVNQSIESNITPSISVSELTLVTTPSSGCGSITDTSIESNEMVSSKYLLAEDKNIISSYLYTKSHIDKEVDVKSAFEAIALALRHNAVIEVQSCLLHDKNISYTLDECKTFFPKLLEAQKSVKTTTGSMESVGSMGENTNSISELERLYRQLLEAIRQKNDLKSDEIKRQIDFYSRTGGKSKLYLSPPSSLSSSSSSSVVVSSEKSDDSNVSIVSDGTSADTELFATYDILVHPNIVDEIK